VTQIWPVGIANIGSKTYFIFFSFNIVSILLIYVFYPETKGRSLEDIDEYFGKEGKRWGSISRRNTSEGDGGVVVQEQVNVDEKGVNADEKA